MTREEILKNINARKTYVTLTPFMSRGAYRTNLFSTIEFTKKEILSRVDNKGAVSFIESLCDEAIGPYNKPMEIVLYFDLGFVIDANVRKDKFSNLDRFMYDDSFDGVYSIRIEYPKCCRTIYSQGEPIHRSKTFLVELDSFAEALRRKGWQTSFGPYTKKSAFKIKDDAIKYGLTTVPTLRIKKKVLSYKDYLRQKRLNQIAEFIRDFFPTRIWIKGVSTDESIEEQKQFITDSIAYESNVYKCSLLYKIIRALEFLNIPLTGLSASELNTALCQLNEKIKQESLKTSLLQSITEARLSFHEFDPVPEDLHKISYLLFVMLDEIERILECSQSKPSCDTLYENIAEFGRELSRLKEKFDLPQLEVAEHLKKEIIDPNMEFIAFLNDGLIEPTNFSPEMPESIGLNDCINLGSFMDIIRNWLIFIIDIQRQKEASNAKGNEIYMELYNHLIDAMEKALKNTGKQLRLNTNDKQD